MTYGMLVNESNEGKSSFEHHRIASDGKAYGIFRECSKYYIKSAPAEKENLAEAYDYLGGWNNRKDYEYDSYANALKHFDLKMMSINEAYGAKTGATTLDPSKKGEVIVEGTEKMRAELARQREIMFNTNVIIREGSYIGVGDPERVSGDNDKDKPYTQKGEAKLDKDMPKAKGGPDDQSEPYGDGKAPEKGKDVKDSDVLSNGKAVATDHPSGGEVTHVKNINEDEEKHSGNVDNSAPNGARDWGTEGIGKGNGDPKENGWEMDGQEYVNEEINGARDWNEGLPGSAGTGEADTAHNNDPYNQAINEEGEEDENEYDVEDDERSVDDEDDAEPKAEPAGEELGGEEELPAEDEEPIDLGAEDELGDEEGLEGEDGFEDYEDESGLEAEIEQLRAEIEALKAQVGLGDEAPAEEAPEAELGGEEEVPAEGGLGNEEIPAEPEAELGGEEEVPAEGEKDIEENRFTSAIGQAFRDGRTADPNDENALGTPAQRRRYINYGDSEAVGVDDTHDVAHGVDYDPSKRYEGGNLQKKFDMRDPVSHADSVAAFNMAKASGADKENLGRKAIESFEDQPGFLGKAGRAAVVGASRLGTMFPKAAPADNELEESKKAYINNLVNEVVRDIREANRGKWNDQLAKAWGVGSAADIYDKDKLDKQFGAGTTEKTFGKQTKDKKDQDECVNEEKTVLHDFGNHPGYRKKPMDLPPTGSDEENGMRDWNDDSVHGEEPFGKSIGDGKPYEKLVQVITDSVMENLKKKM